MSKRIMSFKRKPVEGEKDMGIEQHELSPVEMETEPEIVMYKG